MFLCLLGNNSFFIDGIKIDKTYKSLKLPGPQNTFTWHMILDHSSKSEVRNYCKELFLDDKVENLRCSRPHIYCRYRCDQLIDPIENVRNYHCYTDCVRALQTEKVTKKEPPKLNFMWNPESGNKCDYKPSGGDIFYPCNVLQISVHNKKKFAKVKYLTKDLKPRYVYVNYPNSNFLPCGKGIHIRKDCD